MSTRIESSVNAIIDAMVDSLGSLRLGDGSKYIARTPAVIRRGIPPNVADLPRPALLVRFAGGGKHDPFAAGSDATHPMAVRSLAQFQVIAITDSPGSDDPEKELHRLVSDVYRVFAEDPQLGGTLSSGAILPTEGYAPGFELAVLSGIATATIPFDVTWEWSATAP